MKFRFEVTAEDIAAGVRDSETHCPLANCLRRHFPTAFKVVVAPYSDMQSGTWWSGHISSFAGFISIELKGEIANKACEFDRGKGMEPFSFEVEI